MMNKLGKSLVLLHAALSIAAMCWAVTLVLQARDFGWTEPAKEVLEWSDGKVKSAVLHGSEYDKSLAAATEAAKTRDRTYAHVQPAIDSIRAAEPFLPYNTLFYRSELNRLRHSEDKIEVRRLKDGGNFPDTPLGKPAPEDKALEMVTKSYKEYQADLRKLIGHVDPKSKEETPGQIDDVEKEIRKIVNDTKRFTALLTGTDEANKYVQPGLHQLIDLEFKYQEQIKTEIHDIKPSWSKAIGESRLLQYRRADLEATLEKLKRTPRAPQ
jgi:hypothetical protein